MGVEAAIDLALVALLKPDGGEDFRIELLGPLETVDSQVDMLKRVLFHSSLTSLSVGLAKRHLFGALDRRSG